MKKILFISLIVFTLAFFFIEEQSGPNVSQNGISASQLSQDIMRKYDQNDDQVLNVTKESFLRITINGVQKTESRGLLFTDADNFGNGDGVVSMLELENYLESFDTDGDAEITTYKNIIHTIFSGKSEWTKFDNEYGERYKYIELKN